MSPTVVFGETTDKVLVEECDGIWDIVMSDTGRRNAIDIQMRERLAIVLHEAAADPGCRALVLAGAGGYFCAGGDLSTMTVDDAVFRRRLHGTADVVRRLIRGSKPVVAAVDGFAFGAGLSLAAACDYVVASSAAKFCCSFGSVGLTADAGLHWTLPLRVGAARARTMIMFGEVITATKAEQWGLVDLVVDADNCHETALERARLLAVRPPLALAATKRIMAEPADGLDVVLARETEEQQRLFDTEDFANARQAFFDKQKPVFEGR